MVSNLLSRILRRIAPTRSALPPLNALPAIAGQPDEVDRQLLGALQTHCPLIGAAVSKSAADWERSVGSLPSADLIFGALLPDVLEHLRSSPPPDFDADARALADLLEQLLCNTEFAVNTVEVSFLESLANRPDLASWFAPLMGRRTKHSFDLTLHR